MQLFFLTEKELAKEAEIVKDKVKEEKKRLLQFQEK